MALVAIMLTVDLVAVGLVTIFDGACVVVAKFSGDDMIVVGVVVVILRALVVFVNVVVAPVMAFVAVVLRVVVVVVGLVMVVDVLVAELSGDDNVVVGVVIVVLRVVIMFVNAAVLVVLVVGAVVKEVEVLAWGCVEYLAKVEETNLTDVADFGSFDVIFGVVAAGVVVSVVVALVL